MSPPEGDPLAVSQGGEFTPAFIPGPEASAVETGDPSQFADTAELPVVPGLDIPLREHDAGVVDARAAVANAAESPETPTDSTEAPANNNKPTGWVSRGRGSIAGAGSKIASNASAAKEAFDSHPAVVTAREVTSDVGNRLGQAAVTPPKSRAERRAEARPVDHRTDDELFTASNEQNERLVQLSSPDSAASKNITDQEVVDAIKEHAQTKRELNYRGTVGEDQSLNGKQREKAINKATKQQEREQRRKLEATMAKRRRENNPDDTNLLEGTNLTGEIGPDAKHAAKKVGHRVLRKAGISNVMKDMDPVPEVKVLHVPLPEEEYKDKIEGLEKDVAYYKKKLEDVPDDSNDQADIARRASLQSWLDQAQAERRDVQANQIMGERDQQLAVVRDPRTIAPPDENSVMLEAPRDPSDVPPPPRPEDFRSFGKLDPNNSDQIIALDPDSPRAQLQQAQHHLGNEIRRGARGTVKKLVRDPIDRINRIGQPGPIRDASELTEPPRARDFQSYDGSDPTTVQNREYKTDLIKQEKAKKRETKTEEPVKRIPQTKEAREALDNQSKAAIDRRARAAKVAKELRHTSNEELWSLMEPLSNIPQTEDRYRTKAETERLRDLRSEYDRRVGIAQAGQDNSREVVIARHRERADARKRAEAASLAEVTLDS